MENDRKLLSIGKVSKLKNVSIKSLRYYDSIGILRPAFVNLETNYRYYAEEQLYLVDVISLCLKLGIPLKKLSDYVEGDSINLQKLLYDCKELAEEHIKEIREAFEEIQAVLAKYSQDTGLVKLTASEKKAIPAKKNPEVTSAYALPKNARTLLLVEMAEDATPETYGQYILHLFVKAQMLALDAGYPSGIYYDYGQYLHKRYMFLTVNSVFSDNPADPFSEESIRQKIQAESEFDKHTFRLVILPATTCFVNELTSHLEKKDLPEKDSAEILPMEMASEIAKSSTWFLEVDVMDEALKSKGVLYFLEYPLF
ncbi:MAG: MerR family transcriptional regulator [Lachnospiraceae bacterium]|nr:MerR family transcriptional regulator [Lachnospiraceae bacterium]